MSYPFQSKEYRELFKKHFVQDLKTCVLLGDTEYELLEDKRAILVGMKSVLNGQEITDFGDIPSPSKEKIADHIHILKTTYGISAVEYDYVQQDSPLFSVLSQISLVAPVKQEVSPFVSLPSTWEEYLESLERTDRKELKRKFKRLDTISHSFRTVESTDVQSFEEFIKLHRLSDISKSQFMTDGMKSFFFDLYASQIPGWQIKLAFLDIEQKPASSIFYFENSEELLLYNSGYDPQRKQYSAGLLLGANLIKQAIEGKKKKFDFLRGNERYKYDLGAKDCELYRFMISS